MYIPKQLMLQLASQHKLNLYIYLAGLYNSSLLHSVTGAGAIMIMSFLLHCSVTGAIMLMSFLLHSSITGAIMLSFQTIGVVEKRQDITYTEDYVPQQLFFFQVSLLHSFCKY